MEKNAMFRYDNLTCYSLSLHWDNIPKENERIKSFILYKKEGGDHYLTNLFYFEKIYECTNEKCYEVKNLKPYTKYAFKLEIKKEESNDTKKESIESKILR